MSFLNFFPATIYWRPHLGSAATGILFLLVVGWICWIFLRLRRSHSCATTLRLLAPKALVFGLLLLALFDPAWGLTESRGQRVRLLALVDDSSSMGVADSADGSRRQRADAVLETLRNALAEELDIHTLQFDTETREADAAQSTEPIRGTDIGRCLVDVADRADIAAYIGVVMLTDGGDEHIRVARLPRVPMYVVGMGTPPSEWNDIMLTDVDAPASVEQHVEFAISAEMRAYADGSFGNGALSAVVAHIERQEGGKWLPMSHQKADLSNSRTRVEFAVSGSSVLGIHRYRIRVEPLAGELTDLNNTREFSIEVVKEHLAVLILTRSLGWDSNAIRKVLDRDPGISLTALMRLTGERYLVQGDRQENDDAIERGFPADADILALYKCVIIGSLTAESWTAEQFAALKTFVQRGGAVIFLGGDESFGLGGYASTPIAPLFPWAISANEPELLSGEFPIALTPATGAQDLLTGFAGAVTVAGDLTLGSANQPGSLRAGAISLMDASVANRTISVIAMQPYGQGQVFALATNTLWRWGKLNDAARHAYEVFWRQTIRHLAGQGDNGRFVTVKWDRPRYRAGEKAEVKLQVAGRYSPGELRLDAFVTHGESSTPLRLETDPDRANAYTADIFFPERGDYEFFLELHAGDRELEQFSKRLRIEPAVNEGAALPVDHAFLEQLANEGHGQYFPEADAEELVAAISSQIVRETVTMDIPLIERYGLFVSLFLLLLVGEWILRRKRNLI
ncbi:MAG: putative membrane protein [Rhodothermales bacterium]|jgi:uncharacterized membrane protein